MISEQLSAWQQDAQKIKIPNTNYQVFVKDLGDKNASPQRTILLLHGFPESSYSYHKVVDGLLEQFDRIVAFDMLGYGFSDKPASGYSYSLIEQADVALHVWRQLGITGGHILSHDMGTSVLTELLSRQVNDLLPRWCVEGFSSYTFTNGSMVLRFAKLRLIQKLLLGRYGETISRLSSYKAYHASILSAHGVSQPTAGALTEQDIDELWQQMTLQDGQNKNHLLIRYLSDRKRFEESRWLPALRAAGASIPVHFCWGDADQVARVEMAHYMKNSVCPEASLSIMKGAGHFCQIGSPQLWLQHVCAFYAGLQD